MMQVLVGWGRLCVLTGDICTLIREKQSFQTTAWRMIP